MGAFIAGSDWHHDGGADHSNNLEHTSSFHSADMDGSHDVTVPISKASMVKSPCLQKAISAQKTAAHSSGISKISFRKKAAEKSK